MKLFLYGGLLFCAAAFGCRNVPQPDQVLCRELRYGEAWQKVHAAEALCAAGIGREAVLEEFTRELAESTPGTPWRVGILRVLVRAEPARRDAAVRELLAIADTPEATGRIHAIESLGKLRIPVPGSFGMKLAQESSAPYGLLLAAQAGNREALEQLTDLLQQGNPATAANFLLLDELPPESIIALRQAADNRSASPAFRAFALQSVILATGNPAELHEELRRRIAEETDPAALRIYLGTLGGFHAPGDRALLTSYLSAEDPELRIAAAQSLLTVGETHEAQ